MQILYHFIIRSPKLQCMFSSVLSDGVLNQLIIIYYTKDRKSALSFSQALATSICPYIKSVVGDLL